MTNTLLIRAANRSHPAIDALAARLEDGLARAGYPSNTQLMYAGRANKAQNQTMVVIVLGTGLLIGPGPATCGSSSARCHPGSRTGTVRACCCGWYLLHDAVRR